MPDLIAPMLASAGELPPPSRDGDWAYEMKWDGVRAVVYLAAGRVELRSRIGRDVTVSYPELAGLAHDIDDAVLDGEIVALDTGGRPSFERLQQRMHVADPAEARRLRDQVPAVFFAFDLLRLGPRLLLDRTYVERRELLDRLEIDGPSWQTPPAFPGDGAHALDVSRAQHLEGVLAKRLTSPYRPGARTRDWIKVKHVRTQEVVVGGWRPGRGRRAGSLGSLLVGVPGAAGLEYAGHVGTGFSDVLLRQLDERLKMLIRADSPFSSSLPRPDERDAHWVEPVLVGEVAFAEWTSDHRLRHPAWRGLRPDKRPQDVRAEL